MTTKNKPNAPRIVPSRATANDEIPTVRPPRHKPARASFTRYLAPKYDAFAQQLWAEYKRYCRTHSKDAER